MPQNCSSDVWIMNDKFWQPQEKICPWTATWNLKIGRDPKGHFIFQPMIFRAELLVSGWRATSSVMLWFWTSQKFKTPHTEWNPKFSSCCVQTKGRFQYSKGSCSFQFIEGGPIHTFAVGGNTILATSYQQKLHVCKKNIHEPNISIRFHYSLL